MAGLPSSSGGFPGLSNAAGHRQHCLCGAEDVVEVTPQFYGRTGSQLVEWSSEICMSHFLIIQAASNPNQTSSQTVAEVLFHLPIPAQFWQDRREGTPLRRGLKGEDPGAQ